MSKLSFIVPVYNMEEYVGRCLNSLLNQDIPFTEYEIIVVNDGSTDSSLKILHEYAEKHANIRIVTQENKGLSAARNIGLREATGEYIWHIDSDDWIVENCASRLLELCKRDDLDMLEVAPSIAATPNFLQDFEKKPAKRLPIKR